MRRRLVAECKPDTCKVETGRIKKAMSDYSFTIVIEQDEDSVYIASCPVLQGCYSQGDSIAEAVENIKDAIKLHVEARQELGEPIPHEIGSDKVLISV